MTIYNYPEIAVNPFNRNEVGDVRSVDEIRAAVKEQCQAWRNAPVMHAKCEPSPLDAS